LADKSDWFWVCSNAQSSDRNTQIKQTFGVTTTAYKEHDSGKWCSGMTTNEPPNQQNLRNIKRFLILIQ